MKVLGLCLTLLALQVAFRADAVPLDTFVATYSVPIEIDTFQGKLVIGSSDYHANVVCSHFGFVGGSVQFSTKTVQNFSLTDRVWAPIQYMGASGHLYLKTPGEAQAEGIGGVSCSNGSCSLTVLTSVTCMKAVIAH